VSSALGEGLRAARGQAPPVAAVGRRRGRSALRGGKHGAIAHEVSILTYLTSGEEGLLRHTVFVGLREDKPAREVRREKPLSVPSLPSGAARLLLRGCR
jgi:hypothetical protein